MQEQLLFPPKVRRIHLSINTMTVGLIVTLARGPHHLVSASRVTKYLTQRGHRVACPVFMLVIKPRWSVPHVGDIVLTLVPSFLATSDIEQVIVKLVHRLKAAVLLEENPLATYRDVLNVAVFVWPGPRQGESESKLPWVVVGVPFSKSFSIGLEGFLVCFRSLEIETLAMFIRQP